MSTFPKRLALMAAGIAAFFAIATTATQLVRYKPYGVPDSMREEYEAALASREARETLLIELADKAKPVAAVPLRSHDFGMLDPHQTATHAFEIRNDGEDPLLLRVDQTSCKCTVGELNNDLLGPGESTHVTMTWNTGYQAKAYEQSATISTNDPARPTILLTVRGEVRAELIVPEKASFKSTDQGETAMSSIVVFSQLWDDFVISNLRSELPGFDWHAEPIPTDDPRLADKEARSAWQVRLFCRPQEYGSFNADVEISARPTTGDEDVVRQLVCVGKIRSPINFYSPDIHVTDGLDIGTVVSGDEHQFHVVVRARGDVDRKIEVLDIEPKELQASLEPMSKPGSYRLTLSVPKDCPMVVFNARQKHGYVQVGDPDNKDFSNWFPLHGAVVAVRP